MSTEVSSAHPVEQGNMTSSVKWMHIIVFIVLTFGISWGIWLSLSALGVPFGTPVGRGMYGIGMFGPALAALLVRLLRREGFADAGLRLVGRGQRGGAWMYLAAYLVIPLVLAAGIGLALLTGVQHWAFSQNLHQLGQTQVAALASQGQRLPAGETADQLALSTILTQSLLAFTLAIPFNMIFTFGEEFGWRGYLLPRLAPMGGVPAAIMTGVVWGVWHAPLIVLYGYNYRGHPLLGVGMMVVSAVALGMIFAWLRFRSGSVWPSVLAHAAINGQAGFALIFLSAADSLVKAPIGVIGLIPMLAFASWLAVSGRLRPEPKHAPAPTHVQAEASPTLNEC